MKKLMSLLLALVMCVTVIGCGGNKEANQSKADNSEKKADINVAVFYYDYSDVYISTVRSELDKMLNEAGVKYTDYDAQGNHTAQTDAVNNAIASGANLLVVNIVETSSPDAARTVMEAAKAADIPVIFFNREVDSAVIKEYDKAAFVGTDAPEAGHLQGEMIAEFLTQNFDAVDLNKDGKITYVMFKGQEGNAEAEARTQFAVEDANKGLVAAGKAELDYYDPSAQTKYLVDKDGKWSAAAATDYMGTILGSHDQSSNNMVELVIANNDGMAMGALTALQSKGYNKEGATIIPLFGVDATDEAKAKIKEGVMTGTVKQDNVGMAKTITDLVKNVLEGKALMDGTDKYNVDSDVAKIRVPYQKWTAQSGE